MNDLTRRTFIGLSAAGGAGCLLLGPGCTQLPVDPGDGIRLILQKHLPYLSISEKTLEDFIPVMRSRLRAKHQGWLEELAELGPNYLSMSPDKLVDARPWLSTLEDQVVSSFLMSSDFFFHDADESRPLRFIGFYDPYKRPCTNPFARFDDA